MKSRIISIGAFFKSLPQRLHTLIDSFACSALRANLIFVGVLSLLLVIILESFNRRSLIPAIAYIFTSPMIFIANVLIVALTLSPALLIKRRLPLLFLISAVWLTLGISNGIVLSYRAAPLSAIDFLVVKSMFGMAAIYFSAVELVFIVIGIIVFIASLVTMFIKCPRCSLFRKNALISIAVTVLAFVVLRILVVPITAGKYESGKLADAYHEYGFAYCFTHSLLSHGVERPDDYTPNDADEIIESYVTDTAAPDPEGTQTAIPKIEPNIVIVQLESFFDVNNIKNISFSENPIPTFTSLKENGISGLLRVPHLGGGTSNVEFELLTGMSLDHFGFGEYPYTTVLKTQACESLAANLKTLGYGTHALHNHIATFYDRNLAYASLGFDTFTPIEMMTGIERNPLGWAKDKVLIGEISSALDSTPSLDFVFAVSVQAHGKYPDEPIDDVSYGYVDSPIGTNDKQDIAVYGIADPAVHSKFEYYVNQLYEMDAFISDLIESLEARGEPTVAVFYGDHLPSLPMSESDLTTGDMFLSEYAIWSNVSLGGLDSDEDINSLDRDIETYRLSAYLQQLCGMSIGDITALHQYELATGTDRDEALHTLTYTQLSDSEEIEYVPTDMVYGTREVTFESYTKSGNTLTVHGSNFNEYSVVRLDGINRTTKFIDENTLKVENIFFSFGEPEVLQLTVDGTVLARARLLP